MIWPTCSSQAFFCTTLLLGLVRRASSSNVQQPYAYRSIQVPVSQLYDNAATVDFDGDGTSYPVEYLPKGQLIDENIQFVLPKWGNSRPDNFVSKEQTVKVNEGLIREFHVLYAGDFNDGETTAKFEFEFQDSSSETVELSVKNWWDLHWLNSGPIKTPYHDTPNGRNYNITQMHHWSTVVSSFSPLTKIRFPPTDEDNRLHVFAVTLVPAYAPTNNAIISPAISVKNVRMTSLKNDRGESIVEVTLANLLPLASDSYRFTSTNGSTQLSSRHEPLRRLDPGHGLHSSLEARQNKGTPDYQNYTSSVLTGAHDIIVRAVNGTGIQTTTPGKVFRLIPGDDARVDVGVVLGAISLVQSSLQVEVLVYSTATKDSVVSSTGWSLDPSYANVAQGTWQPTRGSLEKHETPRWWNGAKFGIFIHWGVFSVPAWAPPLYYAEWYDWRIHNPPTNSSNPFWKHHLETYGKNKLYDEFIPEFTGAKFNASQWVDLFATAGAKYFVLVTKHHDGFSLFDTQNSTHRSSVYLGPKRDFIGELMQASRERHPDLRKGTYYSLPEWFNPDYGKYGFGRWPGHLARDPFHDSHAPELYTGRLPIQDYLHDLQLAHMRALSDKYETEIMWCDIGGPNRTLEFAAEWYNRATKAGRQVTMNNRCGVAPDFDTPEYATFSSIQTRSWESSEGIDPYSYGYNRETKAEDYRSAANITRTLVDIASKNGNYLLNLGPTGEGEIIPAMVERLVDVGKWLGHSGSCIYNTTYSFLGAEQASVRFTTTPTSFCIISLDPPSKNAITVKHSVPIMPGDIIILLGAESVGPLLWTYADAKLTISVPDKALKTVDHAWAFKITYHDTT